MDEFKYCTLAHISKLDFYHACIKPLQDVSLWALIFAVPFFIVLVGVFLFPIVMVIWEIIKVVGGPSRGRYRTPSGYFKEKE